MEVFLGLLIIFIPIIFIPMLLFWSVNTVSEQAKFGWYIPHNFWTYLAFWVMFWLFGGPAVLLIYLL